MNRLKSLLYILMLGSFLAVVPGCLDDDLWYSGDGSEDGMAIVNLEANFSPFAGGELSRGGSNVAPARGFNTISDMVILVFSAADKKLVKISPAACLL